MSQSYGRIAFILLGVAVAIYACWKISQRMDAFLYPWADARSGQPLLTGIWVGQLKTDDGPLAVMLDLQRLKPKHDDKCSNCNTIGGSATTCDSLSTLSTYSISGKPADRKAGRIDLVAQSTGDPAEEQQLRELRGKWNGTELALEARLGNAATAANDPEMHTFVALTMQHTAGRDLRSLCESVASVAADK